MTTTATKRKKGKNADKLDKLIGPSNANEDNQARERLITARVGLLLNHSFFGNLATRLKLVNADTWLATAATDGLNFYYNSRFINMLHVDEVQFLFGHEVLHVVYDHIGRRDERDPQLWNIADDYCVNADLKRHKVGRFITTVPCLFNDKYDKWSADEVYDDLLKNAKKIDIDGLLDQMIDQHMKGEGEGEDGPQKMTQEERDQLRQDTKENIIQASKLAKASGHSLPEAVNRMVGELTDPQMNWRDLIQTVLTSAVKTDYSFMRPSRRGWHLDAVLPSQTPGEEIEITVAIDTSGSIGTTELKLFLSEIQGIMDSFAGYKINVLSWDTRVHNLQQFTSENMEDITEYVPGGGGGTDVACVFDHLKSVGERVDRLIVFTDGHFFGDYGDPDVCDTAWIIYGNPGFTAPFGTWAHFN